MEPLFIILAVVAVFALILGRIADGRRPARTQAVLHKQRDTQTPRKAPSSAPRSGPDPLVTACAGDHAKADRLAAFEQRKAPGISAAEARRRALDRLTADRGR